MTFLMLQFDALIERMTGREIIRMYANLRGVPANKIDDVVNQAIKHINLDKWADKLSGDYRSACSFILYSQTSSLFHFVFVDYI